MVLPSSHEGCKKKPQGIPLDESALRDVEAAAIEQQVLVFETATGRGIDEACDRRLGGTLSVPGIYTKLLDVDKVDLIIGPQSSQPIKVGFSMGDDRRPCDQRKVRAARPEDLGGGRQRQGRATGASRQARLLRRPEQSLDARAL
jgi:hypothetical protein